MYRVPSFSTQPLTRVSGVNSIAVDPSRRFSSIVYPSFCPNARTDRPSGVSSLAEAYMATWASSSMLLPGAGMNWLA